jgi:hypothetical protein
MIVSGCGDRLFGTHRQPNCTDTRSHVGAVFKSACLGVSESDECRAAPRISTRASLGCCPGVPATARACPVDWAREGHGNEELRTADLARASQLDCDARSSARRAGVLGPGSVIGRARTSNLGIGGSMGRHEIRAPTGLHYACMQRCGDSLRESSPRSARWECRG